MQLQKEKEDKIQECDHNIFEETELHLEDVHVKYDGIISKARVIKDQENLIEDAIVFEKKIYEMHVKSEEKSSNVKPYRHPHYQETFQGRQRQYNIMKEEDGIIVNIHGTRHHQTTLQQDSIKDQQPLQI